jgi:fusion protein PurCD
MKKIILIGSGAREHAIAKAIAKSGSVHKIICFATSPNPGLLKSCDQLIGLDICDVKQVCEKAKFLEADIAICGPEAPLAAGIMDELKDLGIACIGPTKALAKLESSKGFTRDLWEKHHIEAAPRYQRFTADNHDNLTQLLNQMHPNYVVKADGLMGGKGVKVFGEHLENNEQALEYCEEIFNNGQSLVIEEKLIGVEFSLISITDGKNFVHLPVVQDHKRAYDGDTGPNTGGMGTYSDATGILPFLTTEDVCAAQALNELTINAIQEETGEIYCGFLYGGFMVTADGVKLIEYNVRFGDPEAINLIPLINADWVELLDKMTQQKLNEVDIRVDHKATVCQYVVPKGYPEASVKGEEIKIDSSLDQELVDKNLFIGAVAEGDDKWIMTGSRAIAVLGVGENLMEAHQQASYLISHISGEVFYRKDIGTADLIAKRIDLMDKLRS